MGPDMWCFFAFSLMLFQGQFSSDTFDTNRYVAQGVPGSSLEDIELEPGEEIYIIPVFGNLLY